jgi:hypothetical protein
MDKVILQIESSNGAGPLKNKAACFTEDEIIKKMNDRRREKDEE